MSEISGYSVLVHCANTKTAESAAERIRKQKGKSTIFVITFGRVQSVTVLHVTNTVVHGASIRGVIRRPTAFYHVLANNVRARNFV